MAVLSSDLVPFKPRVVSDDPATNGGRISTVQIINNQPENVFSNLTSQQRLTGLTTWRKVFLANHNSANEKGLSVLNFLFAPTAGADWCCFVFSDHKEVEQDIPSTRRRYGVLTLTQAVSANDTQLICELESDTLGSGEDKIISDGDDLWITDKADYFSSTGSLAQKMVQSHTVSGSTVTITLNEEIGADFPVGTQVATCLSQSDIGAKIDVYNIVKTSAGGSLNSPEVNISTTNKGAVTCEVTVTFTSDTAFTVTSDDPDHDNMGSGNTAADFVYAHPVYGMDMLRIKGALWGGTFAAGDTVKIPLIGSYVAVFEKRVVPANCPPMQDNSITLVLQCES